MDGIYLYVGDTSAKVRPKSKKQVKEQAAVRPENVIVEVTTMGQEREILASNLPVNEDFHFTGPDPYNSRKFYGTIVRRSDGKVIVR